MRTAVWSACSMHFTARGEITLLLVAMLPGNERNVTVIALFFFPFHFRKRKPSDQPSSVPSGKQQKTAKEEESSDEVSLEQEVKPR